MSYIFSLDGFRIDHTRARNKDSDVASAALVDATKDPILPTVTRDLGDVDNALYNGEHTLGILLGPVDINGPVAFSFSITNSGFDRSDTPVARVVTDTIADVAFQAAGAVVGAILGGVLGAGVAAGAGALL